MGGGTGVLRPGAAACLAAVWLGIAWVNAGADQVTADLFDLEQSTLRAVNQYRQSRGLGPLELDPAIATAARRHSEAMASGTVGFGHAGFQARVDGAATSLRVRSAAENVSRHRRAEAELPEAAIAGWIASPVHRKNIEGDRQLSGVGAARAANGTIYLTQIFVEVAPGE